MKSAIIDQLFEEAFLEADLFAKKPEPVDKGNFSQWMPMEHIEKYNKLQSITNRKFAKVTQKVLMRVIDLGFIRLNNRSPIVSNEVK